MYFSFFKLKKWGKKTAAARRHNCAVLPSIFLALFCPNQHCPRSGLTGGNCSFDYRTAGVHSGPELPEEPESPEPPVEAG